MIILKVLIYLLAMFSGTIFSLFVFTAIEAKSAKFQSIAKKIHNILPPPVWTILLIVSICGFGYLFYVLIADYARAGIIAGLCVGLIVFFRSGPNINYKDMEKAAKEYEKEQQVKRSHRGKQSGHLYKGAKKGKRLK